MSNELDADLKYWLAFDGVDGLGLKGWDRLTARFGTMQAAWNAAPEELANAGMTPKALASLKRRRTSHPPDALLAGLSRANAQAVRLHGPGYPAMLAEIADPPRVIYYRGNIDFDCRLAVAVIGTRVPSAYGKELTRRLTGELASAGITIVSGLARGIDALAHQTALDVKGNTIAVLGGGVNRLYPADHAPLARRIVAGGGAIMSEYPPDERAQRQNFPQRNRIVSGMCTGVLVIEGDIGSGALITAYSALEQNREVFALPGNVTSTKSRGPNELIARQHAKLVTSTESILEELNLQRFINPSPGSNDGSGGVSEVPLDLDETERKLLKHLRDAGEPLHIDVLQRGTGIDIGDINAGLVTLEMERLIKRVSPMTFTATD